MRPSARTRTARAMGVAAAVIAPAVMAGSLTVLGCAKTPAEDPPLPRRAAAPGDTREGQPEAAAGPPDPESRPEGEPECERTLEMDHHDSVLEEQRSIGPHRDDFQRTFERVHVDPEDYTPVKATSGIEVGETPVFWWTPAKDAAVVHGAIAQTLKSHDAFVLRPGERVTLGQLDPMAIDRISGLDWLELMVRAHVIGTYAHLESRLCVVEAKGTPADGFTATVDAEHTYYTNEKNVDPYRFEFEIRDRTMTLTGLAK